MSQVKKRSIGMKELAGLAGVSLSTVSRIFNSPELVRAETRERVLRLAREHGYIYNTTAAELIRNKSRVIGLLFPSVKSPLFVYALEAIENRVRDSFYSMVIGSTQYEPALEKRLLKQFLERRVAGIIMTGYTVGQNKLVEEIVAQGIPCVVIWEMPENAEQVSYIGYNNYRLAVSAVEYLIQLKHRHVGMVVGRMNVLPRLRKRLRGYQDTLARHEIPFDADLVVQRRIPNHLEGKQAMNQLLSLPRPPSAVFFTSDEMALGGLSALRDHGLKAPRDISIIGADNIDPCAYSDPPLTTVNVPAREMGDQAIEILLEMIETGDHTPRHYELETNLIIRESCAGPPARAR